MQENNDTNLAGQPAVGQGEVPLNQTPAAPRLGAQTISAVLLAQLQEDVFRLEDTPSNASTDTGGPSPAPSPAPSQPPSPRREGQTN